MIRRLLAWTTLGIFLLNVLGYYGILVGMKEASGERITSRLDSQLYNLGGNITVKVPLALPFEVSSQHFAQNDGEFEMDGEVYRIISQRHYNDTLYVVCLRDDISTRINTALADYVQSFGGQEDGNDQQSAPIFFKDFISDDIAITNANTGWEKDIPLGNLVDVFADKYFSSIIHPPEQAVA